MTMHTKTIGAQIDKACKRIAPSWPLENSVAVNPYLGLSDSQVGFTFLGLSIISMFISVGIYRFIDVWHWYHSLIFITYFLIVFVILFSITQKNKDKRI